jgi:hypothetical protein
MMCDAGHIFCALRCLYRCALMYLMTKRYKIHWTASGTITVESEDGKDAALELAEDMLYNDMYVNDADDLDVEKVETK